MDFYGFYTGKIFDAYQYLGAHTEKTGVTFRTFAPSASRIAVIGEFNDWQESEMNKVYDGNFWECYIPEAKPGQMYKYRIYDRNTATPSNQIRVVRRSVCRFHNYVESSYVLVKSTDIINIAYNLFRSIFGHFASNFS